MYDARALFLMAMILASSMGSIVTLIAKAGEALDRVMERARERHVVERLVEATIRYIDEVKEITWDWLVSTENTTSGNTTAVAHGNSTRGGGGIVITINVTDLIEKTRELMRMLKQLNSTLTSLGDKQSGSLGGEDKGDSLERAYNILRKLLRYTPK